MTTRILVCGGRDYDNQRLICKTLNFHYAQYEKDVVIIHGAAPGVDSIAGQWALRHGIKTEPYPVTRDEWITLGKRAGPMRNQKMIDVGKPDICIAFPGGIGTADMTLRVRGAKIPLFAVTDVSYSAKSLRGKR